jgi:hypothetical protein
MECIILVFFLVQYIDTTIAYNNHDHKDIKIKAGLQMLVLTSYKSGHDF